MMRTVQELEKEIRNHDHAYWQEQNPTIADSDYDALVEELRQLDPENPLLTKLHSPAVGTAKIKHIRPMLSLDKAYTEDEVLKWAKSVARSPEEVFTVSPKYDGYSCEDQGSGVLVTRGDGQEGENISHIAQHFKRLTTTTPPCYGEVVILKSTFARYKGELKYKNTRNALGGVIRNSKAPAHWLGLLTFIPFTFVQEDVTLADMMDLDWQGICEDCYQQDYPTDGVVISLTDKEYGDSLGMTAHHPRHSIALKYANPIATTTLLDVVWQCGKSRISPVGVIEPVELSGVEVSKVTLHNMDFIKERGIAIGATIRIERCGDVIPGVKDVLSPGQVEISCPSCPVCGAAPELAEQNYICSNKRCSGGAAKRLHDALVRLDIENVGPGTCAKLVEAGFDRVSKVLSMAVSDWQALPGFAQASAKKAHTHVHAKLAEGALDYKILAALNFPGVGRTVAQKILGVFTLEELRAGADVTSVDGVGEAIAKAIDAGDPELLDISLMFSKVITTKESANRPTVCFTGSATDGRSRDAWVKDAAAAGYGYSKGVTKKLSVLVSSEIGTTKMKKAEKYGIPILTYEEFKNEKNL